MKKSYIHPTTQSLPVRVAVTLCASGSRPKVTVTSGSFSNESSIN